MIALAPNATARNNTQRPRNRATANSQAGILVAGTRNWTANTGGSPVAPDRKMIAEPQRLCPIRASSRADQRR